MNNMQLAFVITLFSLNQPAGRLEPLDKNLFLLKKTENKKKKLKLSLSIGLGITAITTFLLYNSINNDFVIERLYKNNPKCTLADINDYLIIGFVGNLLITSFLAYFFWKTFRTKETFEINNQNNPTNMDQLLFLHS